MIEILYFKPNEFLCPCCRHGNVKSGLVMYLDLIRKVLGAPLKISSGFRCIKHNVEVKGAKNSRHLAGLAADVTPIEKKLFPLFRDLVLSTSRGFERWEIITYPTFIHIALPRASQSEPWTGGKIAAVF